MDGIPLSPSDGLEADTKRCLGFDREPHDVSITGFYKNGRRYDGLSGLCIACHNVEATIRRVRLRLRAIEKLGGCCSSPTCAVPGGMADSRALQFDHIAGGGRRRQSNGENGHRIVRAILDGSTEFQLLCANCNWIKKNELREVVGERVYERATAERVIGPGRGRGPGQTDGLRRAWNEATPEQRAERIEKASGSRTADTNVKIAASRRGTKLVDGHWIRPEESLAG